MDKPRAALSAFVLALWIGASFAVLGIIGYSFPGIEQALENNPKLLERADFRPGDDDAKKVSTLWVMVGEMNRTYFFAWNATQLGLAAIAILVSIFDRRPAVCLLATLAATGVVFLTFWLAPAITEQGRALDFVPRSPPPPEEAEFQQLHRIYTGLEVGKVLVLCLAAGVALRGRS